MDVADLIQSFADGSPSNGQLSVTRRVSATYSKGAAQPGATSALTIVARPRPATGRDLLRLPEGRRTVETRVFDTTTELLAGGQDENYEADLVTIDGVPWEVQKVATWPIAVDEQVAYTVIVQRVQQ